MHRSTALVRGGLAGLILMLAVHGPQAASANRLSGNDPANRPIRADARPEQKHESGAASIFQRGIHSYGVGAVRKDLDRRAPRAGSVEAITRGSIAALAAPQKISGTPMAGSVSGFRLSPDGSTAVFIADKDTLGLFELYSAPVDGAAAPTKISAGLPFDAGDLGVRAFQISPDSAQVVFLADPNTGSGVDEIFTVPIDGSLAPVRVNAGGEAPVTGFGITQDSTRAVFFGVDTSFGSGAVELFAASIGSASSAVQLSDVGQVNALGKVEAAIFSPDGVRVVYAADASTDNVFQWHSVVVTASGPGSDVQLSAALSSVGQVRISLDSSRVVYTGDENAINKMEVFSADISGGAKIQVNPAMAGDGATAIEISPDGNRLSYLADQDTAGVNEVYGAQMLVDGSGVRLNPPLLSGQFSDTMNISPDGTTVVYEADQTNPGTYDVYGVPIDASGASTTLHAMTPPASAGFFQGLGLPIIGRRAVYPVFGTTIDLFSVPFDASAPFEMVNDPLAAGDALFNVYLPFSATRLMAYGTGPSAGTVTTEIFSAPVRSDLAVEQINVTAVAGAVGVQGYEITSDQKYGVYLQDQDTPGKVELYSSELESDADGFGNATDNCPFIDNPLQGPVLFGTAVTALDDTTFTWGTPLDVRFVRGPLSSVASLTIDSSGTVIETAVYVDTDTPAAAEGWYYLFAHDCVGRSYQTATGAQPDRDLAAFP